MLFYGIELFIAFVNSDGWGNNDVEYPVLLAYKTIGSVGYVFKYSDNCMISASNSDTLVRVFFI